MMRVLVSTLLAAAVYPVMVFVSLEPNVFTWSWEARLMLVICAPLVGVAAYTCPIWWAGRE